ncbi:uncharacterized protein [Diadema antillarum]|uniref:uncharacterized protein n=1 Tax=Diadema antillarum TaxID=105358 RepID=UPI003A86BBA5
MATRMLTPPAPFDISARASHAWSKWKMAFEYYIAATGVTEDAAKRAILLHCVGPDVQQLFATLNGGTSYNSAMSALTGYFVPKKNVAFERHSFRQCEQRDSESVDEYYMRLKTLSSTCEFGANEDDHIRDQFIDKCNSKSLRRRLLREPDLKLTGLLSIARAAEAADRQASAMEMKNSTPSTEHVDEVTTRQSYRAPNDRRGRRFSNRGRHRKGGGRGLYAPQYSRQSNFGPCSNCGTNGHQPPDQQCPARGQECRKCHKIGHYARVCRSSSSKGVNSVAEELSNFQPFDDEIANHHDNGSETGETPATDTHRLFTIGQSRNKTRVKIADIEIDMLVDTGASVNIIDARTYEWMRGRASPTDLRLTPTHIRLFPYGATTPLPVIGEFSARTSCSTQLSTTARFVVVHGSSGCLLGRDTAAALQLIRVGDESVQETNHNASAIHIDAHLASHHVDDLQRQYPEVFAGFGKLTEYKVRVHVDPDIAPIAQPARRIPFHLREKVDQKLQELIDMDIIEPVSGPTSWASPLVVVPKPNGDI